MLRRGVRVLNTSKPVVVLLGKESVGKSSLAASLTGSYAYGANFRDRRFIGKATIGTISRWWICRGSIPPPTRRRRRMRPNGRPQRTWRYWLRPQCIWKKTCWRAVHVDGSHVSARERDALLDALASAQPLPARMEPRSNGCASEREHSTISWLAPLCALALLLPAIAQCLT